MAPRLKAKVGTAAFRFQPQLRVVRGGVNQYVHLYKRGPFQKTWHRNHKYIEEEGHTTDLIAREAVHFLEEYRSQFFARFPETFGLQPMSESAFVWFNVVWLGIWIGALFAVRAGLVIAVWPLWFLALATVLNLFAHPILALRAGGYFPGLLTAPLVGLLGILAIRELMKATAHEPTVTKSP